MIVHIIERTVQWLIVTNNVSEEDREIYAYGLHQGISMIFNIITTLVIGWLCNYFWQCFVFMLFFMPLRSFAGGYHAKTEFRCYLFSIALVISALWGIKYISGSIYICFGLLIFAAGIICLLAPVEDSNKPLDKLEIKVYRKYIKIILSTECLVAALLSVLGYYDFLACIVIAVSASCVLVTAGKVKLFLVRGNGEINYI